MGIMKQLGGCLVTIIFLGVVVGVCGFLFTLIQPRVSSEAKVEDLQKSHILDIAYSIYTGDFFLSRC